MTARTFDPHLLDHHRRVSDLLRELAENWPAERITLADLMTVLGRRGHGLLMLTLALPNLAPVYLPGLSAVTGLPLAAVAAEMAIGRQRAWLPGFVRNRSVSTEDFRRAVAKTLPVLHLVERVLRPRLRRLTCGPAERLIGGICAVLALLLSLPIPLTNMLLAGPVILFSLGVVGRDGVAVVVALLASAGAVLFIATAGWAMTAGAMAAIGL